MSDTCTIRENEYNVQMLRQAQHDIRTTTVTLSMSKGLVYS